MGSDGKASLRAPLHLVPRLPAPAVPGGADRAATDEAGGRKWLRRAVTIPATLALTLAWLALLPVLLAGGAILDLARRRPRVVVRFHLAAAFALVMHLLGLALLFGSWFAGLALGPARERQLDFQIEVWWATATWRAACWLFRVQTRIEGEEALTPGPIILMSRHASLLDTLLPIVFVSGPHRLVMRYVAKRELLFDPVVDLVGHRLPMAFVRRGAQARQAEIALVEALAKDLGPDDAVAIFPEGTRVTPVKRRRILELLATGDEATFRHAQRLKHLGPPHPGGPLALMDHTDVVFCAHTGLEGANHLTDLLAGALLDATVRVRYWRVGAAEIPRDPAARVRWLQRWWEKLDAWVDAQAGR